MTYTFIRNALVCLSLLSLSFGFSEEEQDQDIDMGKLSETFGHVLEKSLQAQGVDFDRDRLIQGIQNSAKGLPMPMTEEEFQEQLKILQQRQKDKLAAENLQKADAFMKENENKENVVTIEPGKLQYEITKTGNGETVKESATVIVHYTGKFLDGQVFGTTKNADNLPLPLSLDNTIQGIQKGVVGMKEGETRTLYVHPDLGYGTQGFLPPNSLLIFEIELVEADVNIDEDEEQDTDE